MDIYSTVDSVVSLLKVKYFRKRIPIAVRVQLTSMCSNRCVYCNIWNTRTPEISTEQVFSLLTELKDAGTKRISFSGGEPLLRNDICEVIKYCKSLGMSPEMNSRGTLIEQRINGIKELDLLKISVDGPEEIHDLLSQTRGSFKRAIKAIELAKENGIKVSIATTITKYNINHFDFILNLVERYDIKVAFQPLKKLSRGVDEMKHLYPDVQEYRKAIAKLIELKLKGNGHMRNSLIGLRHIYFWPGYPKLKCSAGRLFCIIDTDGTLYPCDRIRYKEQLPNCIKSGVKESLKMLPEVYCSGCGFCGSLELNFLLGFKFGSLNEILWLLRKN